MSEVRNRSVEQLIEMYENGFYSKLELYHALLVCAADVSPEHLLDLIPQEHRHGFADVVGSFPVGGTGISIGKGVEPPSDETLIALRAALSRRHWARRDPDQ